jgi:hypothetical protein
MWYFAKVEPIPGMEQTLRTEILWGESVLPKSMVGWVAADGGAAYILLECKHDPAHSGELEDLQRYFKVIEFSSAEPFFVGEHAPHSFPGRPSAFLTSLKRQSILTS